MEKLRELTENLDGDGRRDVRRAAAEEQEARLLPRRGGGHLPLLHDGRGGLGLPRRRADRRPGPPRFRSGVAILPRRFIARSWRISTGAASRSCSRSPTRRTTPREKAWSSARTGGSGCVISTAWISTGLRTGGRPASCPELREACTDVLVRGWLPTPRAAVVELLLSDRYFPRLERVHAGHLHYFSTDCNPRSISFRCRRV